MIKKRNWVFILYPESCPENWKDILTQTGLPICISPLHDKDLNADKTIKKAHYHVILCFNGPTSQNCADKISSSVNGTICQWVDSIKGYYRYLTHKDNPEKAQYCEKDIIFLNGFNIFDYADLTSSEVLKLKKEIIQFIMENNIYEYSELINILATCDNISWFDIAVNNTFFFKTYIDSLRNKYYNINRKVDL